MLTLIQSGECLSPAAVGSLAYKSSKALKPASQSYSRPSRKHGMPPAKITVLIHSLAIVAVIVYNERL